MGRDSESFTITVFLFFAIAKEFSAIAKENIFTKTISYMFEYTIGYFIN